MFHSRLWLVFVGGIVLAVVWLASESGDGSMLDRLRRDGASAVDQAGDREAPAAAPAPKASATTSAQGDEYADDEGGSDFADDTPLSTPDGTDPTPDFDGPDNDVAMDTGDAGSSAPAPANNSPPEPAEQGPAPAPPPGPPPGPPAAIR